LEALRNNNNVDVVATVTNKCLRLFLVNEWQIAYNSYILESLNIKASAQLATLQTKSYLAVLLLNFVDPILTCAMLNYAEQALAQIETNLTKEDLICPVEIDFTYTSTGEIVLWVAPRDLKHYRPTSTKTLEPYLGAIRSNCNH
jgi:hypothetical protein